MTAISTTPSDIEPLCQLARFAFDWAPSLCDPTHGCTDYHRSWSAIRLFSLDAAVPAGWPFFHRQLQALAEGNPAPRVLISGGADTGLMAIVASAYAGTGVMPEVIFTDRCATTVEQNRLYAKHLGLNASFLVGDIRSLDCPPVDAVVAHSFLIFFDEESRRQVVANWGRLLKPGGVLLMSNRLGLKPPEEARERDAVDHEPRLAVLRKNALAGGWRATEVDLLVELARSMWNEPEKKHFTAEHLQVCLEAAGLCLETLDYDASSQASGPRALRRGGTSRPRAEIVARKPRV